MFSSKPRLTSQFATVIAVVALGVPATSAARVDDNIPGPAQPEQGYVDLRSPDAKDSGRMAESPEPVEVVETSASFDWGDAGVGAGSALGLLLITLSLTFAVIHRRGRSVAT